VNLVQLSVVSAPPDEHRLKAAANRKIIFREKPETLGLWNQFVDCITCSCMIQYLLKNVKKFVLFYCFSYFAFGISLLIALLARV
jgi:hypothetical protein